VEGKGKTKSFDTRETYPSVRASRGLYCHAWGKRALGLESEKGKLMGVISRDSARAEFRRGNFGIIMASYIADQIQT
jgi:hypothetical protein